MSLSVEDDLRRAFELATMRREARIFHKSEQWRAVSELQNRCEDARRKEQTLYRQRYDSRVEQRRRQLIDEAGSKTLAFKPWWGTADRFSAQQILLQAQRDVRLAHERRLRRIDAYESQKLGVFAEQARAQKLLRDRTKEAFENAADPERRRNRAR